MASTVTIDLSDSAYDFTRVVWPAIASLCGGGEMYPAEGQVDERMKRDLDIQAGIDAIQILPNHGMRGIASRIQWGPHDWRTFTIRESRGTGTKTELAKRLYAINHPEKGLFYPHITVHAYVSERRTGHLLSAAIAYTRELIPYAAQQKKGVTRRMVNQGDGTKNSFLAVDWRVYQQTGKFFESYPAITPIQYRIDTLLSSMPVIDEKSDPLETQQEVEEMLQKYEIDDLLDWVEQMEASRHDL